MHFHKVFRVKPLAVFADRDYNIEAVLVELAASGGIWEGTQHMYCIWHLAKNVYDHLASRGGRVRRTEEDEEDDEGDGGGGEGGGLGGGGDGGGGDGGGGDGGGGEGGGLGGGGDGGGLGRGGLG